MVKKLVINYEEFEEDGITVMSVVDPETDTVLEMFTGDEAVEVFKMLGGERSELA